MSETDSYSYRALIAYDGQEFFGWQRLADHPTVQGALKKALLDAFGEEVTVQGAGRTDRGAHAEGQVAGFALGEAVAVEEIVDLLNKHLPEAIDVLEVECVPDDFHVRTSAIGKEYAYVIWNEEELLEERMGLVWHVPQPLSFEAMEEALPMLVGKHDFASFGTKTGFKQKSTVREIYFAEIEQAGEEIIFRFQGDSFLNHMVRNMVRALVKVGEGKYAPSRIGEILEAKNRSASPGSAPASGLYLMRVFYPE